MKEIPKVILEGIEQNRDRESECTSSMDVEREDINYQLRSSSTKNSNGSLNEEGLLMLPSNLFNFICMFLKAKEIVNLMRVSRAMREKVLTQAQYAISTIALKLFFSNEIDAYVDYGEEEKYLACKSQRNSVIAEYMKHSVVDYLKGYSKLRSQIQQTPQVAQLDLIFADILNPPMPIMKIRRENVGMHAHSWFQNKLVDVYYDNQTKTSKPINSFNFANQALRKLNQGSLGGSVGNGTLGSSFVASSQSSFGAHGSNSLTQSAPKQLGFFSNHFGTSHKKLKYFSQTVSEIQQKLIRQKQMNPQQQLLGMLQSLPNNNGNSYGMSYLNQINPQKIEQLLDLIRWYRDFDEISLITDQSNPDIQSYIQENTVVLTVLLVSTIFKNQCQFLHQYLEQNSNHATYFDLISEYNLKWNTYQAAVIETQENLEEVYKCFNDLYQSEVGVKMYPQYSVLRVAAQHWTRIVLKPLQERLFEAFFSLLQNRRLENLNFVITADQQKIDSKLIQMYYMPEKLENATADLQQRFQRLNLSKSLDCGSAMTNNRQINAMYSNDQMYQEFFSKNSYYVDNMLYTFCENMMDLSVNEASVHWLGHTDMQVGHIYEDLHKTFLQKTAQYYEELQNQVFQGYIIEWKQFLMGELKYCRKIVKESTFKLTNKLVLENFFKAFTKDIEGKASAYLQTQQVQQQFSGNEDSSLKQKLFSKGLTQQACYYIMNDSRLRKVLESFVAMKEEEEDFNCKSVRDEDIEDINRYRQIKQKLDEDSFAFYDLVGNIDHNLIEKTKNLIRQKLQKQNENQQNIQKQSNIHHNGGHSSGVNGHVHSQTHQNNNHQQNQQQQQNNSSNHNHGNNHHHNSHQNHHHHLNSYPTHYTGSHFLALQNANNINNNTNHFHHHFQQQNQQNFSIQNQYAQQIDDLLLFSQNFINNSTNNTNHNNTSNPLNN